MSFPCTCFFSHFFFPDLPLVDSRKLAAVAYEHQAQLVTRITLPPAPVPRVEYDFIAPILGTWQRLVTSSFTLNEDVAKEGTLIVEQVHLMAPKGVLWMVEQALR